MKMTMEDIQRELEQMARDPESGADKFRALKMLATMNTSATVLPEPLHEEEILARLVRIMRPAGRGLCQIAYERAFRRHTPFDGIPPRSKDDELTPEELGKVPQTLKQFYRRFPEVKQSGFPQGYPAGRSIELKRVWLREQTIKILTDRKNQERLRRHSEMKSREELFGTEAEGIPEDGVGTSG